MSYPALIEKVDTGGPTGGADMPGTEGGGGLMGETRGGKAGEVEGRKGELLVKGEASVELGGNWEVAARGLLKAGREGRGGRAVDAEGLLTETELVPGGDRGLDRPETQRTPQGCFSMCLSVQLSSGFTCSHSLCMMPSNQKKVFFTGSVIVSHV